VQRLLSRQCVAASGQKTEALIEPASKLLHRQNLQPRDRQFDPSGIPSSFGRSIRPLRIFVAERKSKSKGARPLDEKPYRAYSRPLAAVNATLSCGVGNEGTRMTLSPWIATARDSRLDRHPWAVPISASRRGPFPNDMFAIIDDQQELLVFSADAKSRSRRSER